MDAKRDAEQLLTLADLFAGIEPAFLEQALAGATPASGGKDPLEAVVRARVLAQIARTGTGLPASADWHDAADISASQPDQARAGQPDQATASQPKLEPALDLAPAPAPTPTQPRRRLADISRWWQRSAYARMTAAAVLIIAVVWLMSLPFLSRGTASTTAAATKAATTAAAATTKTGATVPATTAAGATTTAGTTAAATTAAGTTAAAGTTTAATTRATTTAYGQISWPVHLSAYLGFNTDPGEQGVQSVTIRRYRADGTLDISAGVTDRAGILAVSNLVNQIYLQRPDGSAPSVKGVRYELAFQLAATGQPGSSERILSIAQNFKTETFRVDGWFASSLGVSAPDGFLNVNPDLHFADLDQRLLTLIQ